MFTNCGLTLLTLTQVIFLARALPKPQTPSLPYTNTTSTATALITFVDDQNNAEVVTSTDIPATQTPTVTIATQSLPDISGHVQSSLETAGNPTVQPFLTSIPSAVGSTLQPLPTSAPFANATTNSSVTSPQTFVIPVTTVRTVVLLSTATYVPVANTLVVTTVVTQYLPITLNGSTSTAASVVNTTITQTYATAAPTTVVLASTIKGTGASTIVAVGGVISTSAVACQLAMGCTGQDIFLPVDLEAPAANIQPKSGHPVSRLGINGMTGPIETNKFYSNFFLGSQSSSTFTVPYSLSWSKGGGNAMSWGMAISHIDAAQRVFGPENTAVDGSPSSYFINPIGIQSLILSAAEMSSATVLTSDSLDAFSANINLQPQAGAASSITFPVVQGMGFVTGVYTNLQPAIQSSVFFNNVVFAGSPKVGVFKYRLTLEDGTVWLLYAMPASGVDPNFQLVSSTLLQGLPAFSGAIQIAKNPGNLSEPLYDQSAGVYATSGSISGFANGATAAYSLTWTKAGACAASTKLLMYALPHHVASFDATMGGQVTSLQLQSTTKGLATAVVADSWTMVEHDLPVDMGFAPWRPGNSNSTTLSSAAIAAIQQVSAAEASQDMSAQTNLNSMYFSGKGLSKFAQIVYTMNDLSQQPGLAAAALSQLKSAFAVFANNQQQFPLVYDSDWKGIVSSASYVTGDSGADFGNSYYNDHHFHYGYFISAAAVIGYLDPSWLAANKAFVNALVRDVSNPSSLDQYFPIFRSFDWYHGHSWAKGLFESSDGKDQESSSEDAMFAYALKMWGQTSGDASMEARGNLMLSLLGRSLQCYFLLESSNVNQPSQFIDNKVTGILFENKVDHTTYFGTNPEYIQGIHMIPLMPFSTLTRSQQFVTEEWETYFTDGAVAEAQNVAGGWRGILYANLAIINPTAAYNFFTQANFDPAWLDGGASLTWYIALAAGLQTGYS